MTGYEQDFIYKAMPRLTEAINNLSSKLDTKSDSKFCKALEDAGITADDFVNYIGCILGSNVAKTSEEDHALIKQSWEFMDKVYKIASECTNKM